MSIPPDLAALRDMLPFYVNGTLDAEDAAAFEAGLAQHAQLQAELEAERAMQARFNAALEEEVDGVRERGAEMAGTATETVARSPRGGLAQALAYLNPVNWKPAVTLGVVALAVAQTAVIGGQASTIASLEEQNYALASGLEECEQGADLIVTLRDTAQWGDIVALLNADGLVIVGSTAQGVLELRASEADADMAPITDRLQSSEAIASVYKGA